MKTNPKFCIVCGEVPTYSILGGLCDEHWVDWWYEKDTHSPKQIAAWKKEDLRRIKKYGK